MRTEERGENNRVSLELPHMISHKSANIYESQVAGRALLVKLQSPDSCWIL